MEESKEKVKEQEVTVEVIPQAVTEIIYAPEPDSLYYIPSEEELDTDEGNEYEIGSVDTTRLINGDLIFDQTESFVFLSEDNHDAILKNVKDKDYSPYEHEDMLPEQLHCSKCNFHTRSFRVLENHQGIHNLGQSCKQCGQTFPKSTLLARHFKEFHTNFTCKVCNMDCTGKKCFLSHMKEHDQKKYVCYTCTARFNSGDKLMNHMETHGTVLLYACNKCDAAFSSTLEVSTHLRQVHPNRNKIVIKNDDHVANLVEDNVLS